MNYFNQLTPTKIWNISQNKPTLIVKDFKQYGIDESISYNILLGRGVFKWFSVRRQLIKLKNIWKGRIINTLKQIKVIKDNDNKNSYKIGYYRGYLKAYEECRLEIRNLCHSDRWVCPDFDKQAKNHLKSLEN